MNEKEKQISSGESRGTLLQNKLVVCLLAVFCCLLWGSAFPSIKAGYEMFEIGAQDSVSQILFAGIRFLIAGVLTIIFGSLLQKKFLFPKKTSWKMVCTLSIFQTMLQYFFFWLCHNKWLIFDEK